MRGFVSYSHEDKKICDELKKPLKIISRAYGIDKFWVDDCTPTGRCFRSGYREAIALSSIHVLLISSNSLWSTEIMDKELPIINEKVKTDGDLVLPVVVDDCLWDCVIGSLLASPRDDSLALKPLLEWRPLRTGINRVGRQLSHSISDFMGREPRQLFEWPDR